MIYLYTYKITNNINGKIYIGIHKTKNINDGYFGSGTLLKKAIKKYGKNNFILEILYFHNTEEELLEKERGLIKEFNSTDKNIGYNLASGQGGYTLSEEGRKKLSLFNKGKKLSQDHINKLKKPRSEQIIKNMKEAQKLRRQNQEPLKWYYNPLTNESKQIPISESAPIDWILGRGKINSPKNIIFTEERKNNISIANKNLEKRKKISEKLKGHMVSEKTREKIKNTLKHKHETSNN